MEEKVWIIAYDIANEKRLRKMRKLCEDFTSRLQYSVYILRGTDKIVEKFKKYMNKIINPKEDSVIIFEMTSREMEKTQKFGIAKQNFEIKNEDFVIIK